MLGTVSIIAIFICGFTGLSPWLLVPFTIINGFVGVHFPPGKAVTLRARQMYWPVYFQSLPIQAGFAVIVFFAGYGVGLLF